MCEVDPRAQRVLGKQFPDVPLASDVRSLQELPDVDLVAAGFPCQDLSQAGGKVGIDGTRSSLVGEVFRLLAGRRRPEFVLLENVSYMLRLDRGRAMNSLVEQFERLGYRWAYRVVDARSFGVPQRRQRVVMLASLTEDPAAVLFADDALLTDGGIPRANPDVVGPVDSDLAYGFYWTEGLRGLGWTRSAVPTVKGGSALGIPSAPAIWFPDQDFVGTPTLLDGERLQGFEAGWTADAVGSDERAGHRWKLIGNAVCVPMAEWVGWRLASPGTPVVERTRLAEGDRWPTAACGADGRRYRAQASMYPMLEAYDLRAFLKEAPMPLSERATMGFLNRTYRSKNLRFADGFVASLENYLGRMA
jgi:DNA (cytosine-5)-methyltransferase 1